MVEVEVIAVGGYNEVGRNMTAVRVGKEIVIFDIGLYLDPITGNNSVDMENMHSLDLIQMGAIPDDTVMNAVEGTVKAIVCTHGHLDHIGAVQKLATDTTARLSQLRTPQNLSNSRLKENASSRSRTRPSHSRQEQNTPSPRT